MMAEITTSCRSGGSRSTRPTRLNLLGWALLCPHARDLLWHGSTPLDNPPYPTSEESKSLHEKLKNVVGEELSRALRALGIGVVGREGGLREHEHTLYIARGEDGVCASSKADIVYILSKEGDLYILYAEAAVRLHVAKPLQALLRGIALYYEYRLPIWVMMVSPHEVRYKQLDDEDQRRILRLINRSSEGFEPSANLCSLCELSHYCPHRVI